MSNRPTDEPEQPRSEPEIIPPGRAPRYGRADNAGPRVAFDTRAFERVYVFRPRPLNVLLVVLTLGAVTAALVVFLLGAVLVALPVVGTIVAIALITAFFRGNRRPVR
ncbi:MAG TPA: hypothetical protein VHT04_03185 [Stellaceae bacterium]|nr:hypothetical protein [Stellaceae bacterium]